MLTRNDFQKQYQLSKNNMLNVKNDPFSLHYHLMPPMGWMNDPNGLFEKNRIYHIYYQYSPFDVNGSQKLWGHYTTRDFVSYVNENPLLYPDTSWDMNGVYSGTAFVENDTIHFFYTGNVKYLHWPGCDYTYAGREQNTIHVVSPDGYVVSDKERLLSNHDYPSNMTKHVRDPKVFKIKDDYYMILGARTLEGVGCAVLYQSQNLKEWHYFNTITSAKPLGYMWECPDIIELEGHLFLVVCPMQWEDPIYQRGYFPLKYNFEENTYHLGDFVCLDEGFDYYAPQSFKDHQQRQIQIAWMGMPQADYDNAPTVAYGWQHALTMPRVLQLRHGMIYQQPLAEYQALRKEGYTGSSEAFIGKDDCYELIIDEPIDREIKIWFREDAWLSYANGVLKLDISACGQGRKIRQLNIEKLEKLQIFSDVSSLEIFINDGRYTMTSRIYSHHPLVKMSGSLPKIQYFPLNGFKITESTRRK